jgi:fermentation-respiration switch protein FrsA (DUF1100 family)
VVEIEDATGLQSDGLTLWGELHRPPGAGPFPGLIVCHGLPAGPPDPTDRGYADLADRLAGEGYATLIFNFRGAGASQGNFEAAGWVRDARAALDWLAARPEVDPARIGLIGFSAGALTGTVLAAEDDRIAALVSCAGPAAIRRLADPDQARSFLDHARAIGIVRDPAFPASFDEWRGQFESVRAIDVVDRIAPRPILFLHGERDDVVPVADARALYDRAGDPREIVLLPEAGHRLRVEPGAMDVVVDWLRRVLRT